jgi:WD40-like Beta Propeller Repeat
MEDPAAFDFAPVIDGAPVLSPDGQLMAFLGRKKHSPRAEGGTGIGNIIVLRRMSTGEVGPIAGTDGAIFPFWSPDGQFLGFFADVS